MKNVRIILLLLSVFTATFAFALPNPAAVNCENHKLNYVMVDSTGICIFSDNSYCEEWEYYRGYCKQGDNILPESFNSTNKGAFCFDTSSGTLTKCH